MSGRAYVLLSGGIDSSTCLALAKKQFGDVVGLSVFYGQRHRKEIEYAKASCEKIGAGHAVLDISAVMPRTALTDPSVEIPKVSYAEIKGVSPAYVPFRNGLLLSAATAHVVGEREKVKQALLRGGLDRVARAQLPEWGLYFGAHAEDAQNWAYADCTPEWIGAMANAIYVGTYHQVRLHAPLEWLDKEGVIRLGESLGVDWSLTWSCYLGGEEHCGECPTCRARRDGFKAAGVKDPTVYLRDAVRDKLEAAEADPVDRSARQLSGGGPVTEDHREIKPESGQQKGYIVLTPAERAKGFTRPYRDAYRHMKCGKITTMSRDIAETYARDPGFYSGTFCTTCRAHFPVGESGEFNWYEMDGREGPKVGT